MHAASASSGESGALKSSEKLSCASPSAVWPWTSSGSGPSSEAADVGVGGAAASASSSPPPSGGIASTSWKFWTDASVARPGGKSSVSSSRSASHTGSRDCHSCRSCSGRVGSSGAAASWRSAPSSSPGGRPSALTFGGAASPLSSTRGVATSIQLTRGRCIDAGTSNSRSPRRKAATSGAAGGAFTERSAWPPASACIDANRVPSEPEIQTVRPARSALSSGTLPSSAHIRSAPRPPARGRSNVQRHIPASGSSGCRKCSSSGSNEPGDGMSIAIGSGVSGVGDENDIARSAAIGGVELAVGVTQPFDGLRTDALVRTDDARGGVEKSDAADASASVALRIGEPAAAGGSGIAMLSGRPGEPGFGFGGI